MEGAQCVKTNFRRCDLREATLRNVNLQDANLQSCNVAGVVWGALDARRAQLQNLWLQTADLRGVQFDDANMSGGTLVGALLDDCSMIRCNL